MCCTILQQEPFCLPVQYTVWFLIIPEDSLFCFRHNSTLSLTVLLTCATFPSLSSSLLLVGLFIFCLLICGSRLLIVSKTAHRQDFCKISCMTAAYLGKVSAQPHTIVKQICFLNGNVLFFSLFSLVKN